MKIAVQANIVSEYDLKLQILKSPDNQKCNQGNDRNQDFLSEPEVTGSETYFRLTGSNQKLLTGSSRLTFYRKWSQLTGIRGFIRKYINFQ